MLEPRNTPTTAPAAEAPTAIQAEPGPALVDQPTGAPTRKTFGGFVTAIVMAFATKTAIAVWPDLLDPANPWQPLYVELLTWLPFLIPAVQYQIKEWAKPVTPAGPLP